MRAVYGKKPTSGMIRDHLGQIKHLRLNMM